MLFTKQIAEANARADQAQGQHDVLKAALEASGHFAFATSPAGKPELALTDAGKAHFAAGLAELSTRLEDATASVQALTQEKGQLEAKLSAAVPDERQRISAAVTAGNLFALAFDAEGKPALSLTDAGKAQLINAEAARALAASGHQPLPVAVDTPAPGNKAAAAATGAGRTKTTWAK